MDKMPLLEMRVRGMEHSIIAALTEYEAKLSAEIKEGVERALSRNNIVSMVEQETIAIMRKEVALAITNEIRNQLTPVVESVVKAQVSKLWE